MGETNRAGVRTGHADRFRRSGLTSGFMELLKLGGSGRWRACGNGAECLAPAGANAFSIPGGRGDRRAHRSRHPMQAAAAPNPAFRSGIRRHDQDETRGIDAGTEFRGEHHIAPGGIGGGDQRQKQPAPAAGSDGGGLSDPAGVILIEKAGRKSVFIGENPASSSLGVPGRKKRDSVTVSGLRLHAEQTASLFIPAE